MEHVRRERRAQEMAMSMGGTLIGGAFGRFSRVWVAAIGLFLISGIVSPGTLAAQHLFVVLQVTAFLGVAAIGQTLVVITRGIDLSAAGVITLTNLVAAGVMNGRSDNIPQGLALVLGLGAAAGFVNGMFVTKVRITPLIATLAMNAVLFGAALIYSNGAPHGAIPNSLAFIGQGHIGRFPVSTVIWIALTCAGIVAIKRSVFGRRLAAVGANPNAAHLSGVAVDRVVISAYVLAGLMSAIAGLLLTAFIGLPSLGIGDPYLLNPIAAVVVGGTALTGGIGSLAGTAGGALFMTQLFSLTNTVNVSTGFQYVIEGAIIVASTAFNTGSTRSRVTPFWRRSKKVVSAHSESEPESDDSQRASAVAEGYE